MIPWFLVVGWYCHCEGVDPWRVLATAYHVLHLIHMHGEKCEMHPHRIYMPTTKNKLRMQTIIERQWTHIEIYFYSSMYTVQIYLLRIRITVVIRILKSGLYRDETYLNRTKALQIFLILTLFAMGFDLCTCEQPRGFVFPLVSSGDHWLKVISHPIIMKFDYRFG